MYLLLGLQILKNMKVSNPFISQRITEVYQLHGKTALEAAGTREQLTQEFILFYLESEWNMLSQYLLYYVCRSATCCINNV